MLEKQQNSANGLRKTQNNQIQLDTEITNQNKHLKKLLPASNKKACTSTIEKNKCLKPPNKIETYHSISLVQLLPINQTSYQCFQKMKTENRN